ncbi:MAG: DUF1294 domain-containing protein [Planctomycetes bacterium]|nr:DUF1294 domain-containing protein [Planctomycetota bacterium]MCB9909928.1 DUF1294 domain-containing protein [Planctomycetota bacterium]MCB9912935.1 DUF1294 domain-containing protein [Planctomycetota bacterium]HPF15083.1 DUF1294 domain-containing protein [Planctomycetota bacterium]
MDFKSQPTRTFLIVFVCLALPVMLLWRFLLPGSRLFAWLVGANASAFAIWALDKHQARKGGWRVPERALHTMAVLGAAPASLAAMSILRHKTQKRFFTTFYSILLVLQLAIGLFLLFPPAR